MHQINDNYNFCTTIGFGCRLVYKVYKVYKVSAKHEFDNATKVSVKSESSVSSVIFQL